jgi:hypothetical protein
LDSEFVSEEEGERGRMIALSRAEPVRRGRLDMSRVVERRRCEQKRQCCVWIGSLVVIVVVVVVVVVGWRDKGCAVGRRLFKAVL